MAWNITGFKPKNISALRDCLNYLKTAADNVFNPTITEPVIDEFIGYNGTAWVNRAISNTSPGLGKPMFLTATASSVPGYDIMQPTPDGAPEVTESAVVHDNTVLIDPYISSEAIGRTSIDAGIWDFSLYGYVSAATGDTNMVARVYTRTTGGTETLLFEVESNNINSTTVVPVSFESVQTAFSCNATDYLVIKIYGKTTHNGDITVSLVHSGTTHYSHIHVPLIVTHNQLPGLQGGASNDYYHLTNAQLTIATQSASASQAGYLLAADWITFNGKQDELVSGTNIKTINGTSLLGSDNIVISADVAAAIVAAASKSTPVNADLLGLVDSEASNVLKQLSWENVKATLKTYFDSVTTTLTNKRITNRVVSEASNATPSINTDNCDFYELTAQAANITSMSTNLTGTPANRQILTICIKGTAARTIAWGSSFASTTITLPTTTVTTAELKCTFVYSSARSVWEISGLC